MNSICRSFVLDTCGSVTAALKRTFALQPAVEDRSVQVVIEITIRGRRAGFWRLVSGVRKEGLVPIQECERDKLGRFTKSGPDDSQRRFPRSLILSISCGHIPGSAVPIGGERKWTGATPPFLPPGSAQRGRLMFTGVPSPGRGRSRPINPWREGNPNGRFHLSPWSRCLSAGSRRSGCRRSSRPTRSTSWWSRICSARTCRSRKSSTGLVTPMLARPKSTTADPGASPARSSRGSLSEGIVRTTRLPGEGSD